MSKENIFSKEFKTQLNDSSLNFWEGEINFTNFQLNTKYWFYFNNENYQLIASIDEDNNICFGDLNLELTPFLIKIHDSKINIITKLPGTYSIRIYESRDEKLKIANRFGQPQIYGEYDNIVFNTESGNKIAYSKLPEIIEEEDDGKVLGVIDGIWQKIEANFITSWDDLTGKPFEEKNYNEEGKIDDLIINISEEKIAVKCFNYAPTENEYPFCLYTIKFKDNFEKTYQFNLETELNKVDNNAFFDEEGQIIVCYNLTTITIDNTDIIFSQPGTYFIFSLADKENILSITMEMNYLKKLDEKFAPKNMATKEDVINIQQAVGAIKQLPANWNETNETSVQYILNKPTNLATTSQINTLQSSINTTRSQLQSKIDANTKLINEHKQIQVEWNATEGIQSIKDKPADVTTETWVQNYILNNRSDWNIIDPLSPKFIHNKPQVFADWNSTSQPTQITNMPQVFRHTQNVENAMLIDTPEGWIKKEIPTVTMTVTFEDDSVKVYNIFGSEVIE